MIVSTTNTASQAHVALIFSDVGLTQQYISHIPVRTGSDRVPNVGTVTRKVQQMEQVVLADGLLRSVHT